MTIGPEPMMSMVERSVRLGIHHFLESLFQRDRRRPARRFSEFGRVAYQVGNIGGAHQGWIWDGLRLNSHQPGELLEQLSERHAFSPRNVVRLTRNTVGQKSQVSLGHIANVEQVTHRIKVAGWHPFSP